MRFYIIIFILFTFSPILAVSTNTQKSIPAKVDSQQVILLSQQIGTLTNKIERSDSLFQKQAIQTVNIPKKESWWKENAGWIKDWTNIVFFIAAIAGTIFTLLYNRRSLFNPLRSEVLKKQLELYSDLLNIIDDSSFTNCIELIDLNIFYFLAMFEEFKDEILRNEQIKKMLNDSINRFKINTSNRDIKIELPYVTKAYFFDDAIKFDRNNKYIVCDVKIDRNTTNYYSRLSTISKNPFVPQNIKKQINAVLNYHVYIIDTKISKILEKEFNTLISTIAYDKPDIFENEQTIIRLFKISPIPVSIFSFRQRVVGEANHKYLESDKKINKLREEINIQLKVDNLK